jgi:hypothetical protein
MTTEKEFEARLRQALRAGADSVPGRVRSRLTQARQAALTQAIRPGRGLMWAVPALGALTAALLVTLMIGTPGPRPPVPVAVTERPTADDLDLLADSDGLDMVQSDDEGFYEWAAQQAEGGTPPPGSGNGV